MRVAAACAALAFCAAATAAAPSSGSAQSQSRPQQLAARVAEGRVLRPDASGQPRPVRGQWVVLHRVGSDRSGPLDSIRSARDGSFRFRFQADGAPDALYFVSAQYGGIAYFSPPLRSAVVRGGDADVLVHDTTTDTTRLRMQGRHIVVSQSRGARREIAEIFEIENQSPLTVVARDSIPLWTTALPEAAESASVAPGDVSAEAVTFTPGRAALFAPLSPGVRQLVLTYLLPNDAFPVSFPMQRPTTVLELLLEDTGGTVQGVQLREVDAATIEGRTFRRLLAQDVPPNSVVRIDVPSPSGQNRQLLAGLIGTVGVAMLLGLLLWVARRGRTRTAAAANAPAVQTGTPAAADSDVDRLIAELAALDARHERSAPHDAAVRDAYQRERASLKARLEAALATGSRRS